MKIIILSASTGGGHMSAAKAIKEYLTENECASEVVDALEYISPILNKTVTETYEYIATKNPLLWKMIYNSSNKQSLNKLINIITSLIGKKLMPLINEKNPDVIVTTHPFTTEMISKLKSSGKISTPLVCIMTDYAPHRTWINEKVDAYIVANRDMAYHMAEMGVDPEKIYPFGIPVDDSFFSKLDKNKVMEELGFEKNIPTILIMAGSYGLANIEKIYSELREIKNKFQVIIITGKNQKLYDRMQRILEGKNFSKRQFILSKLSNLTLKFGKPHVFKRIIRKKKQYPKKTKIIYFTNEVNKYMYISDLIITKPGGLTVSEALASGLPMALYDAIPGQEEENEEFLVSNNMAIRLNTRESVKEKIEHLLDNPKILNSLKYNCENFDNSHSLENIFNVIKKLCGSEKL